MFFQYTPRTCVPPCIQLSPHLCRGVAPWWSLTCTEAPCDRSGHTRATIPFCAARWSGARPPESVEFTARTSFLEQRNFTFSRSSAQTA